MSTFTLPRWLSVIESACALALFWLYLAWVRTPQIRSYPALASIACPLLHASRQVPHLYSTINNVRVASQAAIFYCAVLLLFLGFLPGGWLPTQP